VFTIAVEDEGNIRLAPLDEGGGTLYDIGIYCINAARYLFQDEPYEVVAFSANSGAARFRNCDELTSVILRFPGERLATFSCSFSTDGISSYRIAGTRGHVRLDPAYEYAEPLRQYVTIDGQTEEHKFGKRDQFAPELIHFSSCVLRGEEPEPSGLEGLADVRIIRAAYDSAARGLPVRLPPLERDRRPSLEQTLEKPGVREPEQVHARGPSQR
jgi:glucose-fructose oxidoreductase